MTPYEWPGLLLPRRLSSLLPFMGKDARGKAMTLEQFQKLDLGDILISPMGSEIVVARVERKRAHMLGKALVTKKALMQGGSVVDAKNFQNWQRKGSLFGDAE